MTSDIGSLVGAIDQGTSSTRFIVFSATNGFVATYHQVEVKRHYPREGWVEQDPNELFESVLETSQVVWQKLSQLNIDPNQLKCIGLTNQRESTIVWDKVTGEPLYNSIVWLDNRTTDIVESLLDLIPGRDFNWLKKRTGLPISTYFSALKLKWLINSVPKVREAIKSNRLLFGTVDTWILWKLASIHETDVTNASRTLLMNIETLDWDHELCEFFGIPTNILPKIRPSSHFYGRIRVGPFSSVPITGIIGDQNAALVGQQCFGLGQVKVTYGTGCFLMQNLGPGPIRTALGPLSHETTSALIVTVAYQFGDKPAVYALEGSVGIAGAAITWLRDNIQLVRNYSEVEYVANEDSHTAGVYFVPALQGLYAPHWDPNASGTIIGITQFTKRCHIVRATLEGVAFQANDILTMMKPNQSGIKVDGGMSSNDLLCQFLANISAVRILRPKLTEATALGAALIAGYTLQLWPRLEQLLENGEHFGQKPHSHLATNSLEIKTLLEQEFDIFEPKMIAEERVAKIQTWKKAVARSLEWHHEEKQEQRKQNYQRLSTLPLILFVLISFGIHVIAS